MTNTIVTSKDLSQKLADAGYVQIITDTTTNPSLWLIEEGHIDPNNLNQN